MRQTTRRMPDATLPDTTLAQTLASWRARVETTLADALPPADDPPTRLHAAMRHAALVGGKRMRPMLVYACGEAFGADAAVLDAAAAGVELIHAYSLVHDDLPAMDDDDLRRGKPTVHVAFDEATAILAGDALQSLAFELLASAPAPDAMRVAMLRELAVAAGARGMCGGQALDIDATGQNISADALTRLHELKTGALLRAAVRLGAIAADVDRDARQQLDRYADALGLAFQLRDDLLDIEGDSAIMGKHTGQDAAHDKATFPALLGIDTTRQWLGTLSRSMDEALTGMDDRAEPLRVLARLVVDRNH